MIHLQKEMGETGTGKGSVVRVNPESIQCWFRELPDGLAAFTGRLIFRSGFLLN